MKKIVFLSFFLAYIICVSPVLAVTSTYDVSGYTGSFDLTETGITFNYSGSCEAQMASTNTFTTGAGTFDSTITWKSPDSNILGFSTLPGLSNTSCLSYGRTALTSVSVDPTSTFYESSYDVSQSADSGFVTTETRYLCDVAGDTIIFEIGRSLDSRGDCQYRRRAATGLNTNTWINSLIAEYNRCGDLSGWIDISCNSSFASGGANDVTIQYIYPFNSSSTGTIGYDFSTSTFIAGSAVTPSMYIDIIDTVSQTNTTIHSEVGALQSSRTFAAFSGSSSLTPRNTHLFVITYQILDNGIAFSSTINPPIINLSIFTFAPDYVCGDFGPCINGSQSQVCVDSLGIAPDEIRTRSCFDVPSETITLGFEESISPIFGPEIYICQKDWTIFGCNDVLDIISAAFPVNWTVSADADIFTGVFRQNYIRISPDTATEGTKSLQMNYIPPKPSEPVNNGTGGTVCGNKTIGDFPFVSTGFNETMFVARNISFPSPFIQFRLDVRKCQNQILQYDYTGDFLGINCGTRCYAPNCTGEPKGSYAVGLLDLAPFQSVLDFTDTAMNSWKEVIIDISNVGITPNHNYTLVLLVNPSNQFDPEAHCVYIDDFRVTITETALPACETFCDGFNLLLASSTGDVCSFQVIQNSPACAPDQSTAEAFEDFQPVCIGTSLHFFNNVTGLWDQTENSDLCIEQISQAVNESKITEPLGDAETWVNWILFLVSPIFIYFFISIAISGAVGRLTEKWEPFGVTFAFLIFVGMLITLPGSSATIIPLWVGVAMISVISLLMAATIKNFGSGSGGG